ncbi:hypothetical protein COCCADRAFT_113218 [Bipolaris zeicola 26-R-13]|uniref:Uncharacterized protein n=1 Tax=Cochliobolus carbonum (strain 26-R-13) TaxID=930089 RepID=W6XNM2_COCC2|nr:uncharacterized protein COCCADRAFT_113218 [Bipolaris zeicola 26-R-13]EUC26850.1 hypothetical protein COCCADRAFT_113218 [Bipolaris zeicola 26-R-13]
MDNDTPKWNNRIPVSKQEPDGAWSNLLEFEALMQGKSPESGLDVVDIGDGHDGDERTENGNNRKADRMAQRSSPEQSNG